MAGRPGPKINSRDSSISYPHHSRRIKKQQHSRPFTSSNHSQQRVNPSQTPTFGTRCDSEHSKLQRVLANQLKNDISKASAEGIFCDLELELNHTQTITTHNCIVEARARRFYLRFCCGKKTKTDKDTWRVILPFGVSENLISGFLRNLYKEEDTFNEESFIISHIDECLATSPNYEAYITPQLTPGDISDIPQVRESLKRSSSYYYSLVTLDELDQEKDLLEQELEEQDELIRSFQQIKVAKKPTYLNLSRTSQRTEQTKQLEAFLVEEITPPIHVDPPVQTESSLSSPCSLHTPEEMSRTQDSGMESGLYTTTDETFKSLAPSDTSGVLEDQKANACATMASISDAESDREDLPLEENKVEEKKEKIVKSVEALISLDSLQSEKKSEERDELLIDFSDSPVKKPNLEAASRMKNGKFSEQISKSLLEMQDLIFLQDVGSTQSVEPKRDEPFCLITSIEQDYLELSSIATSSKINSSAIPQFNTYDVNKSSNRSSGNYFIDASSLLDETEIPSTDWMSSKPDEKISIAGVTTSSSSDAPNVTAKNLVTFAAANMESPILITQVQRAQEKRELTEHEQVLKNKLEVIAKYKEEASDPPDRQDIEKKQGSLLFKGSIPAYSKHVTGSEGQLTGNKLEEPPFPSIDFTKVNTTAQDVQTPDSLNGIVDEDFGSHNASVGKECKVGGEKSASIKPPTETPTSSPYFARKLDATAWVVDMGEPVNCNAVKKPKKNFLSSQLATVKLEDQEPENVKRKNSGLGFFVDISDSDTTPQTTPRQEKEKEPEPEEDKKKSSFFYIDIGNGKAKSEIPKKLAERRPFSREVSREEERKDDEIVVKRRSGHSIKSSTNRLSWHEAKAAEDQKKHKRAQSLSGEIKPDGLQKSDSMTKIESGSRQDSSIKDKSEKESCSLDESLICEKKVAAKSDLETLSEYTKVSRTFVRLSDMDNRSTLRPDSKLSREGRPYSKKVEETSWIENKLMVRDSRSSMRSKSPGKGLLMCHSPNQDTDESEMSSMQSSVDRSVIDASTEETDISSSLPHRGGPCSRLGEDLLRMFIEEINTDVVVDVAGRRIKAHKCILSSRCQYFAAMLSGGWVESAGNVISIQGFSFHAVHFALSHIYSGTNNIPDSLSIVELATLTDMLGLEGLKEVIMYTLKVKYCHFFHKPCSVCAVGVLECLPLAAAYGLDEIYHKSLKWITKYFVRIWPSKAFANLPRELVDKCYLQHVVHMSVDNVLDTVMSCDRLLATLPSVRWAEAVYALTSQLLDACVTFMAEHFSSVLTSERFVSLGKELSWNISRLEDSIMSAVDCLPPEQACQSHTKLSRILTVAAAPEPPLEMQWSASFVELLERIKVRVEAGLIRMGSRAMRCKSWAMLASSIRTKVQESACLGHDVEDSRRSRSLSLTKNGKRSRGGSAGSSYGSAPRYQGGRLIGAAPPNLDLRQVTLAMTRGQPVATVQPMPQRKAPEASTSTHHPEVVLRKRQTRGRPSATTKVESRLTKSDISSSRPKSWPQKVMENQTKVAQKGVGTSNSSSATGTRTATPEKSSVPARVKQSSSESSRTSSPAFKDKQRPQAIAARKPLEPMKSASSSHIPVAKPFLSPVLRGSRISDSASSKSVSETRTKNSPIPALRSRIMNRSSQPCLTDRRPSNSSIGGKSSTASSPAKQTSNPSIPSSPARKKPPAKEEQRPPFRFGGSSSAERKPNILMERAKAAAPKRPLKGQENKVVAKKVEPLKRRQPMPLSQSSSAPAINKGFKPKLLSNSSRSGTFLKDEPTILKKPVIK